MYKVEGKIIEVGEIQTFENSSFQKRQVVIEVVDGDHVNQIPLDLLKDKVNMIGATDKGKEGVFHFNLIGSKPINGRRFLNTKLWKWESKGSYQSQPQQETSLPDSDGDYDDSLPF